MQSAEITKVPQDELTPRLFFSVAVNSTSSVYLNLVSPARLRHLFNSLNFTLHRVREACVLPLQI